MKPALIAAALLGLTGCASTQAPSMQGTPRQAIDSALALPEPGAAPASPTPPAAVPEPVPAPIVSNRAYEPRVSVAMNNVPARQFFMALTSGTQYTLLLHPNVTGLMSAKLQDMTVPEALEAVRDLYDLDITLDGNRITVRQPVLETRVFTINYPTGTRRGSSDTRVAAGSLADVPAAPGAMTPTATGAPAGPMSTPSRPTDSSRVSTAIEADFWSELKDSLTTILGAEKGRSIVISPQSGIVVARGMPRELRDIANYLKATQLSVERQVILEAKIIEVQLSAGYQAGVNWAAFRSGNNNGSAGIVQPGSTLSNTPGGTLSSGTLSAVPGTSITGLAGAAGTMFGLALQGTNFAALISFLETQGAVQVLSSPRISALNNQQAVLKVGTDEFFVTGVTGGTTVPSAGGAVTTTPNVSLRPFFSGVVLDVLPQIDADGNIILHIRPSVSQVTTVTRNINLGVGGQLTLPLASNSTSETDSVIRARNGQVVVIGGLMREASDDARSQVPGAGNLGFFGKLFGSTTRSSQKRELIILLRPTVVSSDTAWTDDIQQTRQRLQRLGGREPLAK
ncbi:MAG: pilus type biosis protein MshL [Pseudomonadota bacterium]